MTSMRDNATLCWSLREIGLLDVHNFEAPCPSPQAASYSICFWFTAQDAQRRQIIINQGDDHLQPLGWSIGLEAGTIFFRLTVDPDQNSLTLKLPHVPGDDWHSVAVVLDREQQEVRLHHQHQVMVSSLPATDLTFATTLLIGGYTDPAGGHYNHTFGRHGSGLVDACCIYTHALTPQEIEEAATRPSQPASGPLHIQIEGDYSAPTRLTFTITPQNPDNEIYIWAFGDGHRALGPVVQHRYTYQGTYEVSVARISADHFQSSTTHILRLTGEKNPLRQVSVFQNDQLGCACFRIPSVVRTQNGTLLAFAEGRVESCSDSTRIIVGAMSRSVDSGQTWETPRIVFRHDQQGNTYAVQNISPVVDTLRGSGHIIVVYNGIEHSEWDLARGIGISRAYCVISEDDGLTWSVPVDITPQIHRPYNPAYARTYPQAALPQNADHDWRIQRPTLGHAIQLQRGHWRGRIVHVGVFTAGERSVFQSQNYIFYSDDLGKSWQIAGVLPQTGLNEAALAELDDGRILVNSRAYRPNDASMQRRALTLVGFDADGMLEVQPTHYHDVLVDPAVQASMIACPNPAKLGNTLLLFANPAHLYSRVNMTVRVSMDQGKTWNLHRVIDSGPSAYSDMVYDETERVTLIYERGNEGGIAAVTFPLRWLLEQNPSDYSGDAP